MLYRSLLLLSLVLAGCSPSANSDNAQDVKNPKSPTGANDSSPFDLDSSASPVTRQEPLPTINSIQLTDVAAEQSINHTYLNGEEGRALMLEATGGGCGWGDFDRDGQWDLYLNQGGRGDRPADEAQPNDALYRNMGGNFDDITSDSRIAEYQYSQGVSVGDFDNDGFDDIYVSNFGPNTLWHNMGDGTFVEIGEPAGVADPRWSSTSAWADLDLDGDLDLYVCNYLQYDPVTSPPCTNAEGEPRICHPREFKPWADECFINQGNGTFTAEAKERGLYGDGNKGLGVAVADFNNDGLPDIYVANDTTANFMFINQGDAQFKEEARVLGCASSRTGAYQASMGLAIADMDRNGWLDIYISHYESESNTLYHCLGEAGFDDVTADVGLHYCTMPTLGFGVIATDFNSSGILEFFVGNGHVNNFPSNPKHRMRSQVLAIENGAKWQDISDSVGEYLKTKRVTRGVAKCDFDNDGDMDVTVVHQNDPVGLLRNDSRQQNWIKLQFLGLENNRRGIGCRAVVHMGDRKLMQELHGGGSFAVSHQPMLHFGLGDWDQTCDIEVRWPNGATQILRQLEVNQEYQVVEPAAGK